MTRQELLAVAKPELFNTEMVRAIKERRKAATRRLIKLKYNNTHLKFRTDKYGTEFVEMQNDVEGETWGYNPDGGKWHKLLAYYVKAPPHKPGDIIYVRETWGIGIQMAGGVIFRADYPDGNAPLAEGCKWRPSIHMPKDVARIFLRVLAVKPQHLQDSFFATGCTIFAIEDEGIDVGDECRQCIDFYGFPCCNDADVEGVSECGMLDDARQQFAELWDSTIKPADLPTKGWAANPWVWAYNFERVIPDDEK